jgi:hypothetical protein
MIFGSAHLVVSRPDERHALASRVNSTERCCSVEGAVVLVVEPLVQDPAGYHLPEGVL